jgi:hypothetical protein
MPNDPSDDDLSYRLSDNLSGNMALYSLFAERKIPGVTNTAFVLRLTWNAESRHWHVLFKPTDGGQPRVFADLETALLYIARLYPDPE